MMIQRIGRRLRYFLQRSERERLLREEMEIHVDIRAHELMEDGMAERDARAAARRAFGNALLKQEDSADTWVARWLRDLMQDGAYALRTLRKRPGFSAVAVLSASIGIGSCSAIFSIANYALFHPLPIQDSSRLMSISARSLTRGKIGSVTWPDFEDLRRAGSLQGAAAFFPFVPASISAEGDPQRHWGSVVTANYFDVVRPPFVFGHGFDSGRDDRRGEAPKVVLSHQLWQIRFASDPFIVGKTIEFNGQKVIVAGVTGPGFRGTEAMFFSEFWMPLSMLDRLAQIGFTADRLQDRGSQWLQVVARLRTGIGVGAAAAELDAIGAQLRSAYPATNKDRGFYLERAGQLNPGFRKMIRLFFFVLLGVTGLVLLTSCANVATLLLARAWSREREIATRVAIGAGRGRLVRQLLTESLVLSMLGGAGGYAIAQLGVTLLGLSRVPLSMPVDLSITLDHNVTLFCVIVSVLTGLAFGLVPSLRATRGEQLTGLKQQRGFGRISRGLGMREALIAGQVAICTVLLICSGLFFRSLQSARNIDPGFSHRNVLLLGFDPSLTVRSPDRTRQLVEAIVERTTALPGVQAASLTSSVPLNMEGTQNGFAPEDGKPIVVADIYSISPRFFETLGVPFVAGEDFRRGVPADDIVIINEALAAKAFPGENALGRRIAYQGRSVRITGVVATTKSRTIGEEPHPSLYFPIARDLRGNDSLSGMTLLVRTAGDPAAWTTAVRDVIRSVDPGLAIFEVRTMDAQISRALYAPRIAASLFGIAGLMGLVVATMGLYGVISFLVAGRTKEIGIRMAVGATRANVVATVLIHGLVLTALGCAIGLGIALAAGRLTANLLFGVHPADALTFASVLVLLHVVAVLACAGPAARAASVDPIGTLRYE